MMVRARKIMKYSVFVLPVLFFQYCRSQSPKPLASNIDNNTLLWEITGNGIKKPSYLFGTFHLMCKEDINFSPNLKQAISNSSEMYLEMKLDDPANTLGALLFINMKEGKTLKDLYATEEYQRVNNFFRDSLGTGLMLLERMKPNFLQALLYPKLMACKDRSGVEEELMKIAKTEKKEIKGFETIAFQASVFDSIPYEDQAKDLLHMIDSIPTYSVYFSEMLNVYKKQELSKLESMFKDPQFNIDEKNQEVLLDKRNSNWVDQLKTVLPKTNVFIAVGAGHLVGEKGLISLLKKEGYELRPLLNK